MVSGPPEPMLLNNISTKISCAGLNMQIVTAPLSLQCIILRIAPDSLSVESLYSIPEHRTLSTK